MKSLVRILLAADIILALIAGPLIVAGGGLGTGTGGSSFAQKTNLASSVQQQTLALGLVKAICEDNSNLPKDEPAIKKLAQEKSDASWCDKPKAGGIAIAGSGAQVELKSLFQDQWDVRVLYAISYLYQKRFSANGYNMICKDGSGDKDKVAPSMTVAIHTDASTENANAPGSDYAASPHERGQAFDVLTYGCTTVKEKNEVKMIIPNIISTAGMSADEAVNTIANSTGQSAEEIKATLAGSDSASAVAISTETVGGVDPTITTAAGTFPKANPVTNVLAATQVAQADAQQGQPSMEEAGPSSDPTPSITGALAHMEAGLETGTYDSGAKPEEVGTKSLEAKLGIPLDDPVKVAEALGASAEALNVSPETYGALKNKDYKTAAQLEGARRINEDLKLGLSSAEVVSLSKANTTSAVILARSLLLQKLPVDRAQTTLALLQGGYLAISNQLEEVDAARKSEKPMQLAQALFDTGQLATSEITTLRDYLSGDQVARDGATLRFEQSGASQVVLDWMKANKNMPAEDQKAASAVLDQATKSVDMKGNLESTLASVKGLATEQFFSTLDPVEKESFVKILGKNPPTAADLEAAGKDGSLQRALEAAGLAKQLQGAGMSDSDAAFVAAGAFSEKPSVQTSALSFFNKKNGTNFTLADFKSGTTPGGHQTPPKAAVFYAQSLIAQKTGLTTSQVQTAIEKRDPAVLAQIAQKYAPDLKLPVGLIESVLKDDKAAKATEGVKLQDKKIIGAVDGTPEEKQDFQNKLDEQMDKAINKGEQMARQKAADLIASKGISAEDAKTLAGGNFKNAQNYVMAAALSNKGVLSYDQAKNLLDKPTLNEKYAGADSVLNYALHQQGINVQVDAGFTKTMFDGTDAQRLAQVTNIGAGYYAPELVSFAANQNINISNDQAQQILQNHDWKTIQTTSESVGIATASDRISQATGVPSGTIQAIANNLKASGGELGKVDMENAGWDIGQSLTGISKDSVLNIENNFATVKDNMITKYQNMPGQMMDMAGNIGAGIIINTLIGGQLAKIDPTGGMLTSYAMSYATSYLMTLGIAAPYLLAAALIINPEATIAAVKAMVMQAFELFTNPAGFVMGILGQMGLGSSKPFTGAILGNPETAATDVLSDALLKSTAAAAPSNASEADGSASTDTVSEAQVIQNDATGPATGAGTIGAAITGVTAAAQTSAMSKYVLSTGKPTPQYLQKVAQRSIDQAIEDLMVFGVMTTPKYHQYTEDQKNQWTKYMGSIEVPSFSMAAKQVLSPEVINLSANAPCKITLPKDVKILYESENSSSGISGTSEITMPKLESLLGISTGGSTGSSDPPLGTDGLTGLSQLIYGSNFYPACSYGRVQGLLYDSAVSAVHFGV